MVSSANIYWNDRCKKHIKDVSIEHTNSVFFFLQEQILGNFIESHEIVFNLEYFYCITFFVDLFWELKIFRNKNYK